MFDRRHDDAVARRQRGDVQRIFRADLEESEQRAEKSDNPAIIELIMSSVVLLT